MIFRNWLTLIFAFALSITLARAQDSSPTPTPDPHSKGNLAKAGLVRVWYFGDQKSPRITVVCEPASGDAAILGSYLRAGQLRGYRAVRPGTYSVKILDGSVTPDANGHITGGTPITPPEKLELKAGTLGTIVIRESDKKFTASTFGEELAQGDKSGPTLRVFDYSGAPSMSLRAALAGEPTEIWNSTRENPFTCPAKPGQCRFELWRPIGKDMRPVSSYETTINPSSLTSVVIYTDRYGEPAMSVVDDREINISADELKGLSGSN